MKLIDLVICVLAMILPSEAVSKQTLSYKIKTGHIIQVDDKHIYYDKISVFTFKYPDIELNAKENRLIENNGAIFLFLFSYSAPNLDRFEVYQIFPNKALLIANSIASPIKDYDHDGRLEFGGRDLSEMHPSRDSMYYIPTKYFEINKGKILLDKRLTKAMDIKINGLYLSNPMDKDGNCCKTIPITKKMREMERLHRR